MTITAIYLISDYFFSYRNPSVLRVKFSHKILALIRKIGRKETVNYHWKSDISLSFLSSELYIQL